MRVKGVPSIARARVKRGRARGSAGRVMTVGRGATEDEDATTHGWIKGLGDGGKARSSG